MSSGASRVPRGLRITGAVALALVFALVAGFAVWANVGVFRADPAAVDALRADDRVSLTERDGAWVLAPTGRADGDGIVVLPGAKVDPLAYAPTFAEAAAAGTTVVIPHLAFNLAFFDPRGLDDYARVAPDVRRWAVAGHSLGGVRACQLADDETPLILLGSYCANDLSHTGTRVLSVSGSADGLSTPAKVRDARRLLPADAKLLEIDGANHASFGSYGPQPGDGDGTRSADDVHRRVAAAVDAFLGVP